MNVHDSNTTIFSINKTNFHDDSQKKKTITELEKLFYVPRLTNSFEAIQYY